MVLLLGLLIRWYKPLRVNKVTREDNSINLIVNITRNGFAINMTDIVPRQHYRSFPDFDNQAPILYEAAIFEINFEFYCLKDFIFDIINLGLRFSTKSLLTKQWRQKTNLGNKVYLAFKSLSQTIIYNRIFSIWIWKHVVLFETPSTWGDALAIVCLWISTQIDSHIDCCWTMFRCWRNIISALQSISFDSIVFSFYSNC